ncbi:MAG: MmgE/PrpD family protein [Dehalococcoidales bacterium]|nr:MAG: MmgE/PrpD family protein [Dehalococcoidales bacterium]
MSNSDKGIYLDKLIDNILNTKLEDIPAASVDHAKNRLFDVIGCMICGANDYGNPALLELIRDWGGKPEARIFVHGDKVPAPMAALVNCIMARSFDYEPVSPLVDGKSIPGHISGTTTMTALTVGDMQNVSGEELLTAMLVGDDMATRILLAGEAGGTRRGFDHVGQANSFGATAITGRMMGLNHEQFSDAFGLVVDHLGGVQRQIGDTTVGFKLSQGNAARDAIFSVKLAKAGWSGIDDALLGTGAYYDQFTDGIKDPELLVKDLGKQYYSDGTFKPYPNCRMNHSAVDCAVDIVNEHGISGDDIEKVIQYVSPGAMHDVIGQPFRIKNSPHASAGFSIQYSVANVLVRGSSKPEHYTEEAIRDTAISDFITDKITMEPLTQGGMESGRVKVIMKDGREFDVFTEIARGDPRRPISKGDLLAKFRGNIEFSNTVAVENGEKILEMVEDLENVDNVQKLVDLLIA